ncbi:MAG TPA: DUF2062 domain-containing protein [Rheinheimera sp.]|uniref:DUF2062 domain-containing protein n=1 Tax=Rheinheimera sp. TaxID=1869214 RepID=UPI000EF08B08|nr:DUF2062 domain-containing protein [Rheinheimera sp.]HCU66874.1 DUF2062 domain-containing protein [Rheinheimera sp.]
MAKNFIKKYLPDPDSIKNHQSMQIFGKLLHDGNLWHLHRRSARGAFAAGLFAALMPMPGQTVLAAALAILFRVNIPIAVALCWVTNPFTMAPIFYICYNIGTFVLGQPPHDIHFEVTTEWLIESINTVGKPFLIGSLIFAAFVSALSWFTIDAFWRLGVARAWRKRAEQRSEKSADKTDKS